MAVESDKKRTLVFAKVNLAAMVALGPWHSGDMAAFALGGIVSTRLSEAVNLYGGTTGLYVMLAHRVGYGYGPGSPLDQVIDKILPMECMIEAPMVRGDAASSA